MIWLLHFVVTILSLSLLFMSPAFSFIFLIYLITLGIWGVKKKGWLNGLREPLKAILLCLFLSILVISQIVSPIFPLIPEIGRNLPANFSQADKEFNERTQKLFPLGADEKIIIEFLENQNFKYYSSDQGKGATFKKPVFPCDLFWNVSWKSDMDKKITEIHGKYGGRCL